MYYNNDNNNNNNTHYNSAIKCHWSFTAVTRVAPFDVGDVCPNALSFRPIKQTPASSTTIRGATGNGGNVINGGQKCRTRRSD